MVTKRIWIQPKSGIGPALGLFNSSKLTPEKIDRFDPLARIAVDLADKIRARIITRQEDAFGVGGFGPFNNSGGMWASLEVRVTAKESVRISFYGRSAKSTSYMRNAVSEENDKLRAQKKKLIKEKVVKVYPSKTVPNALKAAASIGVIVVDDKGPRPEFRRDLLQPSVTELSEMVESIAEGIDRAVMEDALEYDNFDTESHDGTLRITRGTYKTTTKRVTEKTP